MSEREVRRRTGPYTPPADVPCGFCGSMTYPGVRWPALPGMALPEDHVLIRGIPHVWCCDNCSEHLWEEDDRVISVKVTIEERRPE